MFPYLVVGYKHFEDLSPGIRLALIEGVIGDVLTKRTIAPVRRRFKADYGMSDAEFDALHPKHQREEIEDRALGVEVQADMTYNPINAACWKLQEELDLWPTSHRFVSYPSAGVARTTQEPRTLLGAGILNDAETVVRANDLGHVTRTVWLPISRYQGSRAWELSKRCRRWYCAHEG